MTESERILQQMHRGKSVSTMTDADLLGIENERFIEESHRRNMEQVMLQAMMMQAQNQTKPSER